MNLCTNAWQAMEKKGEILEVAVTERDMDAPPALPHLAPGRYVEIVIADQGMGIDPEIKERIYDPFFTTKDADKGSGLGLAMVHGIVTGLKGGIVCDSVAGQGTTFTIYPEFPNYCNEAGGSTPSLV